MSFVHIHIFDSDSYIRFFLIHRCKNAAWIKYGAARFILIKRQSRRKTDFHHGGKSQREWSILQQPCSKKLLHFFCHYAMYLWSVARTAPGPAINSANISSILPASPISFKSEPNKTGLLKIVLSLPSALLESPTVTPESCF